MERRQSRLVLIDTVRQVGFMGSFKCGEEGEFLTASGMLFQVFAEAHLEKRRPKSIESKR